MIIRTYIFKGILQRTAFLTAIVCMIVAMINSIKLLEFLVNRSLKGTEFLIMIVYLIPQYMIMSLPFTVFIGTLNTYNSLSQSRELTILLSIGRSPLQILRPSLYAGLVCSIISLIGYGYLMPEGWHRFQSQKHQITNQSLLSKQVIAGKFQNIGNDSTMFVETANGNRIGNIFIYNGTDKIILTATQGEIIDAPNTTKIILKNGTQQSSLEGNAQPPIISFEEYEISFNTIAQEYSGKQKVDELTNTELWFISRKQPENGKYISEFARRIIDSVLPLLLTVLGAITVIIKPISRMTNPKYTIVGSIVMVFCISVAMTLSTKSIENSTYLYYNAFFIISFLTMLLGGLIIKSNAYKRTGRIQ